jgi:predicted dehydrogenase
MKRYLGVDLHRRSSPYARAAKHFGVPHAFADPYKMVQHPDVDLVSICVRVSSSAQQLLCRRYQMIKQ